MGYKVFPAVPGGSVVVAGGVEPNVLQTKFNVAQGASSSIAITFDNPVVAGSVVKFGFAGFFGSAISPPFNLAVGQFVKSGSSSTGTLTLDVHTTRNVAGNEDKVALLSIPVSGDGTLTLTFNNGVAVSAQQFYILCGAECEDVDTSASRVNATSSANSSTSINGASGNVATGGAGIIWGMLAPGSPYGTISATPTADYVAGQLAEQEDDSQYNFWFGYRKTAVDITDSVDVTWQDTSPDPSWVAVAAAYKSSTP